MNKRVVMAILKKDIRAIFASKKVWMPLIVLPLLLCIVVPAVLAIVGTHFDVLEGTNDTKQVINTFMTKMPSEDVKNTLMSLDSDGHKMVYLFVNFLMAPFFLMVTVINSMVLASNSFVGEKERKTLETLLFAPISVKELFLAKILATLIPTLVILFGAFILSATIVDSITYSTFSQLLMPNGAWLIMMLWVIPICALFNILLNILISAKMKTFQEAQQIGGLMVLPVVAVIAGQSAGLLFLNPMILGVAGIVLLIGNLFLFKWITKKNERNALFESQVH